MLGVLEASAAWEERSVKHGEGLGDRGGQITRPLVRTDVRNLFSDLGVQGSVWKTPLPTLSSGFVVARCLSALDLVMYLEVMAIIR